MLMDGAVQFAATKNSMSSLRLDAYLLAAKSRDTLIPPSWFTAPAQHLEMANSPVVPRVYFLHNFSQGQT